jgi:uridine kinase
MQAAPLLIGIAGGTGSGKTTLAQCLVRELGQDVTMLEHDWYYRDRSGVPPSERESINYDEPAALENALLVQHLAELRAGRAVECPQYDFATHTRKALARPVGSSRIVAVEGILLFAIP